jgi:hypothetical protein
LFIAPLRFIDDNPNEANDEFHSFGGKNPDWLTQPVVLAPRSIAMTELQRVRVPDSAIAPLMSNPAALTAVLTTVVGLTTPDTQQIRQAEAVLSKFIKKINSVQCLMQQVRPRRKKEKDHVVAARRSVDA